MTQDQTTTSTDDSDDYEFLSVKTETGQIVMVARSQVWWVEVVERSFLRLHTATGESYLWRGVLKDLEQHWAKHGFVRIHKSYLAILTRLSEPRLGGWGWVTLLDLGAGTKELPVGRKRVPKIKQLLKQGPHSNENLCDP